MTKNRWLLVIFAGTTIILWMLIPWLNDVKPLQTDITIISVVMLVPTFLFVALSVSEWLDSND